MTACSARVPCAACAAPRRAAPHSDTHTLPHPAPITDAPRCRLGRVCCTRRAASALCLGAPAVIRPCVALRFGPPRVARWWLQALGSHLCAPPLRSSPLVAAGPQGSSASLRLAPPASPERRCLARGAPAARLKAFFLSTHVFVVTRLSFFHFSLSKKGAVSGVSKVTEKKRSVPQDGIRGARRRRVRSTPTPDYTELKPTQSPRACKDGRVKRRERTLLHALGLLGSGAVCSNFPCTSPDAFAQKS